MPIAALLTVLSLPLICHFRESKIWKLLGIRILVKSLQIKSFVRKLALKAVQPKEFQAVVRFFLAQSDKSGVGTLAGKMGTVVGLVTRLPIQIWFEPNPKASDTCFEDDLLNLVTTKTLLIVDQGFYHFLFWSQLQSKGVDIIYRLKAGAAYAVEHTSTDQAQVKDLLIRLGVKRKGAPQLQMRLVQVKFGSVWYSYITTVVEPERLPPYVVVDLYCPFHR